MKKIGTFEAKVGLDMLDLGLIESLTDEEGRETVGGCLWPLPEALEDLIRSILGQPPTTPDESAV